MVSDVGTSLPLKMKTRSSLMFLAETKAQPIVRLASELLLISTPTSL